MAKRQIMRIDVTQATLKKLPGLRERDGMTSLAMMSKLVAWFSEQDKDVQNAIVHPGSSDGPHRAAKLIASRMSA
jgi:hypothetical protein